MRASLTAVFLIALITASAGAEEIKVRIDGPDAQQFLDRLNENGKEQALSFVLAPTDYQYRVAMAAESLKKGDLLFGGGADASAAVLTPDCELLFVVSRGGRATKGGAMNALSKEITKKLADHIKKP